VSAVPRLVFADTETVRIKPGPATIWELALIERSADYGDAEYLWQIRPDLTRADPMALKVGGYYERCQVRSYPPGSYRRFLLGEDSEPEYGNSRELAKFIAPMLAGAHLIAANPGFDAGHMDALLRANGECPAWDYHLIDLGSLVRGWAAAQGITVPWPLKVDGAARLVGLDPGGYEAHTALGDVRMGRDIFDRVMAGGA
jgi:hypothetical protein